MSCDFGGTGYEVYMSIATRTGDDGTTGLLYNRRVSKTHPQVEAYGTVDELNAALGLARASARDAWTTEHLLQIQKDLVALMGELAVAPEDRERYLAGSFPRLGPEALVWLDSGVAKIEAEKISFEGWATPGGTAYGAALDLARTICRRAERRVWAAKETGIIVPDLLLHYLNRLSDFLWLLARRDETRG